MTLELLFKLLAVIFIGIAVFFLWRGNRDGTFVASVLGAVCFFLSVRFQIAARNKQREENLLEEEFDPENEELLPETKQEREEVTPK